MRAYSSVVRGMIDYLVAAVLLIFIVAVLVLLWRREHR